MMHYKKGENVEEELTKESIPIESLPSEFLWMHVKHTYMNIIIEFNIYKNNIFYFIARSKEVQNFLMSLILRKAL